MGYVGVLLDMMFFFPDSTSSNLNPHPSKKLQPCFFFNPHNVVPADPVINGVMGPLRSKVISYNHPSFPIYFRPFISVISLQF